MSPRPKRSLSDSPRSPALRSASESIPSLRSKSVTSPAGPARPAAIRAEVPVPAPASITRSPGRTVRSTTSSRPRWSEAKVRRRCSRSYQRATLS